MHVGVGYSELPISKAAGTQAVELALLRAKRSDPCDLVLLFNTARHDERALRAAVADVVGPSTPVYGGGAVGVITNEAFGYAGDQVGCACLWLDGVKLDVLVESGLRENEEATGERLGRRLLHQGAHPDSPMMLFYDAVDVTDGNVRLLMATWLLNGLLKGMGFLPDLAGAGLQGDHICTPTELYTGFGTGAHQAMALKFSDDIRLDTAIMHGCRPASPYYTVTKAEGPVILEIEGQPALTFLDGLLGEVMRPDEYPFFLIFGINHGDKWAEYDENNYASRLCLGIDPERGGIVMFEPDMVAGTEFQIMFRSLELDYMKPKLEAVFDQLDGREPVFAMYIDCAGRCAGYGGVDMEDAVLLQQVVNHRVPLLGLYTGVEIAPMGGRPRGLDWTGVFCLFSMKKPDEKSGGARDKVKLWESRAQKPAEEAVDIGAAMRLLEEDTAKILSLDAQSIVIRHELEQKRRGFSLLSELTVSLRNSSDYENMFHSAAQRINAALNMQKTAVLLPDPDGRYRPEILQGYSAEERARLKDLRFELDRELLDPEHPVLINGSDAPERLEALRRALNLNYFVSAPVSLKNEIAAVLITGRMVEQTPFLSRLSRGDVETVEAIGALMSSLLVRLQLDEAEERAQAMLDGMPLCANFWNRDYQNIDCNQEAVTLFELANKQEYLDRFSELSPEFQPNGRRSDEMVAECIQRAFKEGFYRFEWMHQKLNGEPMPSEITLVRMEMRDGDVVIGYTRDLRELKRQMAEIERTQEELLSARDHAEESSRAKSVFLANMSHEIRTPMNAIIGMTEIARSTDDMERIRYCLNKIFDASGHLLGVINDILDMSKIDAGKFSLSLSEFNVEDMLQKVTNVVTFRIDEKGQDFVIKVDKDVPARISADQQHLTQVITNLLSNAMKFTPEGGKISLLLHKDAEADGLVTLRGEVIDNGIGITEEQKDRLFKSFEQADGSISRRFGGTGLGLAISKGIVEMMGGHIWVESVPTGGSRFQFTAQVKPVNGETPYPFSESLELKDLRILVVDDAPEVLEYFKDILETIGVACLTADSAEAACALLERGERFHILFVDWRMPGMDGVELTRLIREKYGDQIVVVMISATAWSDIEEQAISAGVNRFIAKPLLPSPIVDCINELIGVKRPEPVLNDDDVDIHLDRFIGKRVLLVEDIEINREIFIALTEDTGLEVETAENGLEAVDTFRDFPDRYDLILMDIHMPEMDGYQATRAIRAMEGIPRAKTIPIIAMTANVFREDIENCLAAGMNDHVGKPLDIDEVLRVLDKYL